MQGLSLFLVLICLSVSLFAQTPQLETASTYTQSEQAISSALLKLKGEYKLSQSTTETQQVLDKSRQLFIKSITDLADYWIGTPWTFHGISQTPQEGSIACGYFVTTLLQDVGVKVQRAKLAQQTSENIIKSLSHEKHISRYSNKSLKSFVDSVNKLGEGVYIVGLDYHVGFLWHDGETLHFIHSTFVSPGSVIHEPALSSPVLKASNYRVVGKISDDMELLKKWLLAKDIVTRGLH